MQATGTGTVAFDVVGTLFSLEAPRARLRSLNAPERTLELWFASSLRDYFARSHSGAYTPLAEVLRASLPRALAMVGSSATESGLEQVMLSVRELDPAPGAAEACELLAGTGWKVMTLTNSSREMTEGLLRRAGLLERVDEIISCDSVGVSKPHPDVYREAQRRGEGPVWLIAAHGWDVAGAKQAGLKAAWVSSPETIYLGFNPPPEVMAPDILTAARDVVSYRGEGATTT